MLIDLDRMGDQDKSLAMLMFYEATREGGSWRKMHEELGRTIAGGESSKSSWDFVVRRLLPRHAEYLVRERGGV